MESFLQGAT